MPSEVTPLILRIFLGSPGDVLDERILAMQTLNQLPYDPLLFGRVFIQIVAWDNPRGGLPMQANLTPQDAIRRGLPKPSECDIAVFIFCSRIGTPLPPEETKPEKYQYEVEGISADRYLSGSEWEYVDALQANERVGRPAVLVYRRREVTLNPDDPDFQDKLTQRKRLDAFFASFWDSRSGAIRRGLNEYRDLADFQEQFEKHVKHLINERLKEPLSKEVQLKEALINPDYLDAISPDKYDAELIQDFVLQTLHEFPLRIRALELCFKWGFVGEDFLKQVQADYHLDIRKALASNICKYGILVSEEIISALLQDSSLSVEHAAIDAARALIEKGYFSSAVLRHASNSEFWEVRSTAVFHIVSVDDKYSVATLSHFKSTTYHKTRNRIREYFERLYREDRLRGEDLATAIGLLAHYATDGASSETTTKKLNQALELIQGKVAP